MLFKEKEVDALFVPFANYGQEEAVAKLAKELDVPLLIWGPRDGIASPTDTYRPTDSQCGIFAASKVLRRYGIKFTHIEICEINDVIFEEGFNTFIETARIVSAFKKRGRIAQISVRPQQFLDLMVNEAKAGFPHLLNRMRRILLLDLTTKGSSVTLQYTEFTNRS